MGILDEVPAFDWNEGDYYWNGRLGPDGVAINVRPGEKAAWKSGETMGSPADSRAATGGLHDLRHVLKAL